MQSVKDGIGVALEPERLLIGKCDVHARWLTNECPMYAMEEVRWQGTARPRHGVSVLYMEVNTQTHVYVCAVRSKAFEFTYYV